MKRIVDFLNLCLVTNRGCNLRCTHCYVEPELLKSTYGMDKDTFRMTYQRMAEVFALSKHLTHQNVEILGGEISRMPFEFWEEMLPFAIREHERFGRELGKPNSMAWCTNMIIQDPRYFDLLNSMPRGKDWGVFIPWEPDTQRFGTHNKLFGRYMENVRKVQAPKTLNLIPTKALVSMPIEELAAFVVEGTFDDISCDMLYPYGSGKKFFDENQPSFLEVSEFYIRMTEAFEKIPNLTQSPWDEVRGCLQTGSGYNLNGNDVFDVTVEPDGTVVLNSSMTGSEAPLPSHTLHVSDPLWGIKLMFENAKEMHVKFDLEQKECDQCTYLRYCNGGYYHYKYLTQEQMALYSQGDCPGYRKYWEYCDARLGQNKASIASLNHQKVRQKLRDTKFIDTNPDTTPISEASISVDYQRYFETLATMDFSSLHIHVDQDRLFGLSVVERLWFYDAIGAVVDIAPHILAGLSEKHRFLIARNTAYDNYACIRPDPELAWDFAADYPQHTFSARIIDAVRACRQSPLISSDGSEAFTTAPSGLVIDERNDELFRFVIANNLPPAVIDAARDKGPLALGQRSSEYLRQVNEYVRLESLLRDRGVVHT